MASLQFNPYDYIKEDSYPWPDVINPNVEQMGVDMDSWIDHFYTHLPETARQKYKKMNLHWCTARMTPNSSYEQVIPSNRFMLNFVTMDDQAEFDSIEQKRIDCDRYIEILDGSKPKPSENGIFHLFGVIGDEYRAFMPSEWVQRFIRNLDRCFKYGIQEETIFKLTNRIPNVEYFMVLREYSVNMYPYLYWPDIENNFVLPQYIEEHPVMMRIRTLAARLQAWLNDFYSLPKELALETETVNIILVLQKAHKLSLHEAAMEAKRIHDADVSEFVALHENLPDFGVHQQKVYDYIKSMGIFLQALLSYYLKDTVRYLPQGEGFYWPEREPKK